jgi:FMN-dependent NADH-azoreductase
MTTLLQIHTSLNGANSLSSSLADRYLERWRAGHPAGRVIVRDAGTFAAFTTRADKRTAAQSDAVALSDALIDELREADELVLGVPMYNFGVPSPLKAWFDHIARAGVTFRYTPDGPVGLLGGRRVRVFATRGGHYAGTSLDTQTPFLTTLFGFLGIDDIEFVYAEGTSMGEDALRTAIDQAHAQIASITAAAA